MGFLKSAPGILVALVMALAGPAGLIWVGYWFALDRPALEVGVCHPWRLACFGWGPGASTQLAEASAAFRTEQTSFRICNAALASQNAAVARISAEGAQARARSDAAVSDYASAAVKASAQGGQLGRVLANTRADPECQRYWAVNEFISERTGR